MSYTTKEGMVEIVKSSIEKAEQESSKLSHEVSHLRGFSSPKIRHFMNNVCSYGTCKYLEIGTWSGSTLIPAMFGNDVEAMAIDNFSQFGPEQHEDGFDAKKVLYANIEKFLGNRKKHSLKVCECNCFYMKPEEVLTANVFFYDGDHSAEATQKAIEVFGATCLNPFLLIVDDLQLAESVWEGTKKALNKFTIHASWELKKENGYHEGLYVAVLEKI